MTIVLQCAETQMNNAKRQLEDIVNVWAVIELGKKIKLFFFKKKN